MWYVVWKYIATLIRYLTANYLQCYVKRHIEIGIRNGIKVYAEKISKKLAESLNV